MVAVITFAVTTDTIAQVSIIANPVPTAHQVARALGRAVTAHPITTARALAGTRIAATVPTAHAWPGPHCLLHGATAGDRSGEGWEDNRGVIEMIP
eukprot:gene10714-biopygen2606